MTVLPLLLAVLVTARYTESDPRFSPSDNAKPLPIAEGVTCEICYSSSGLSFLFRGPGEPAGRLTLQVRPAMRAVKAPVAPFVFAVDIRENGRMTDLLAPVAHTRLTPRIPVTAQTRANVKGGWETLVTVPFRGRLDCWPFPDGARRPCAWLAAVRYEDGAGRAADWGTAANPLQIAWGRVLPFKKARDSLFRSPDLVEAYREMRAKYCDLYEFSQVERWIGYLDPGVETFAWRQADSERLFHQAYAAAIANEHDEAFKLLEHGMDPSTKRRTVPPKALKLADPAKDRLFRMIDSFNYVSDDFSAARRKYLNDRFMGRKVEAVAPVVPKRAASAASKLKAPDVSVEEGDVSLDDEELQF